ncbi:MAG TPA: hypothetical protein DCG75_16045 [Bacteroidales bacterium]|nr:hypothetical protein [Bacteroidales bacterium]
MNKANEKEVITQQTINLNSIDAKILKDALIQSKFLDQVNNPQTITNLVKVNFTVNDFLIENETLDSKLEKSKLSCFFQGYYELCKELIDSKSKVEDINPDTLKKLLLKSRVFDNIIDAAELVSFYTAVILLVDSMFQDEITEPKEKSKILSLVNLYNKFLKELISKLEL